MKTKQTQTPIQKTVLEQIHTGSVHMRPRAYFFALAAIGTLSSVTAGLILAYLISMSTYALRIYNSSTPAYGARQRLADALDSFPWWLVMLAILLTCLAIWFNRKYGRLYRHKISTVIAAYLLLAIILGIIFSFTNIGHHEPMNGRQQKGDGQRQRSNSAE